MVSLTSNAQNTAVESLTLNSANTAPGASSADSTNSFSQQLLSALESFLSQSRNGSQVQLTIQQEPGQNSGGSQYLVTLTNPTAASPAAAAEPAVSSGSGPAVATPASTVLPAASSVAAGGISGDPGMPLTTIQQQIQSMEQSWAVLTPSQVAFQLANAAGTGGGAPTATVPGTTLTFGDLNQTQQLAYQYGVDFGTGGLSMQDFLKANAGPDLPWNLSYNQIQANPQIMAAADSGYTSGASGTAPVPVQPANEYATPPPTSGNQDNLPNPALIPYLPADQQAAAWAALAAAGEYGSNAATAAEAYAKSFMTA